MKKIFMISIAILFATLALGQEKYRVTKQIELQGQPKRTLLHYFVEAGSIIALGKKTGEYYEVTFEGKLRYMTSSDFEMIVPLKPAIKVKPTTILPPVFYDSIQDIRDGHTYKTIKIGNQTWTADNLSYLPKVSPSSMGSQITSHYYVFDYEATDPNVAKTTEAFQSYGVLYNWVAAVKACPMGWHLPNDNDWTSLVKYLQDNGYGFEGSGNGIGKSIASISGWYSSTNKGEVGNEQENNNSSGFAAIPAGYRKPNNTFTYLHSNAEFWSATEDDFDNSGLWGLTYCSVKPIRVTYGKDFGVSVRCLKDQ